MRIRGAGFLVPRAGNSAEQCEDAMWPLPAHLEVLEEGRGFLACVADGASEGFQAGLWARALAETLGSRVHLDFARGLAEAVERWEEGRREFLRTRAEAGRPLHWFEEAAMARGAAAAVLELRVLPGPEPGRGRWTARAVGDVCVFQVARGGLRAFPVRHVEGFGATPELVPSRRGAVPPEPSFLTSTWTAGDLFFLATDALALWFLQDFHGGGRPWETLCALPPGEFAAWVDEQRSAGRLKDDDVALMALKVG